jgi:hypothetical protein
MWPCTCLAGDARLTTRGCRCGRVGYRVESERLRGTIAVGPREHCSEGLIGLIEYVGQLVVVILVLALAVAMILTDTGAREIWVGMITAVVGGYLPMAARRASKSLGKP